MSKLDQIRSRVTDFSNIRNYIEKMDGIRAFKTVCWFMGIFAVVVIIQFLVSTN